MSKNHNRYKEDLSHLDINTLEDLETKKFERFHPKKKEAKKQTPKKSARKESEQSY